ncbi:MAG: cytochrome c, partial [Dehalococcoidia bacterium]|nr:cytochrome c [Dehalococcoidia bacterium]
MRVLIPGALFAGLIFLAMACSQPEPTATPLPTTTPAPAALYAGHQLFVDKGCVSCHGQNAGGSSFAP